jgi:hypothetical protein
MSAPADPSQLLGLSADERLLGSGAAALPESERFAELPVRSRSRAGIVAAGTTLTALSLLGGGLLAAAGLALLIADGIGVVPVAMLVVGALLVATHWGWVHVAEAVANGVEDRANSGYRSRRGAWLQALEPHSRWSVVTTGLDDGSIRIERFHHRPVRAGERTFTFERESDGAETHSPDELTARVVERAEEMRREAALATAQEHERWRVAADAYDAALAGGEGDAEERAARAAAARALSEQINRNLREPPLVE